MRVLVQRLFHFFANGFRLRRTVRRANHEVLSKRTETAKIENGDGPGFFFLCGKDGELNAFGKGIEFHEYRPCFKMYSSTRAETSPWMDWPRWARRRMSVAETSLFTF